MSVIRIKHDKNYVCIHKGALEDPNLSFKAKGLWTYCMSKPDDWEFHVNHLATVCKDKKTAIYSAIKELIKAGYCEKIQLREKGRNCGVEYIIHEVSELKKSLRHSGNLNSEILNSENQPLVSNDSLVSNESPLKPPNPQKGGAPEGACEQVAFGKFVSLEKKAYEELCTLHGFETIMGLIEEINDYLLATGKKAYKDYAAAIRQWLRRRKTQQQSRSQQVTTPKLNDIQEKNWNLNQELVNELKLECPDRANGLNFFYKHHILKDRNNPSFDVSGLIDHRDFCRVLGKHLKLNIEKVRFPNVQI